MSVEYFPCSICSLVINDHEEYHICANCEATLCPSCYEKQCKSYDTYDSEEFGKDALEECSACDPKVICDLGLFEWLLKDVKMTKETYNGES